VTSEIERGERIDTVAAGLRRPRLLVVVQLVYALVCLVASVPLIFALGPVAEAANRTSERILGGALVAFAFGAVAIARDPGRNRALFRVELVFTVLAATSLLWRLLVDGPSVRTWLLLVPLWAAAGALLWLYRSTRE
jgi:hypothetical protein